MLEMKPNLEKKKEKYTNNVINVKTTLKVSTYNCALLRKEQLSSELCACRLKTECCYDFTDSTKVFIMHPVC